jgi:hypothetical protein
MITTKIAVQKCLYNLYPAHFSVERILMIEGLYEKKDPKFPWGPKLQDLTVAIEGFSRFTSLGSEQDDGIDQRDVLTWDVKALNQPKVSPVEAIKNVAEVRGGGRKTHTLEVDPPSVDKST